MSTRYLPVGEPDPEVFDTPDYSRAGWTFAAASDLRPGPVADVLVAVTGEDGREQCDVQLLLQPTVGCSMRVRARHHVAHYSDTDEEPMVETLDADLEGVDNLRISLYGSWGRLGLAAALREAAEMLEAADRLPDGT
ncbi:hypothetical protein [Kitasatospora sp. NBC_00315]|uniref:hypothetical protein n=1 Tax=Kitasatospora sp. NBC_00315 TaxID=2975963 RepID=UPI003247F6B7